MNVQKQVEDLDSALELALADSPGCPSPEQYHRLALGELGESEERPLLDHSTRCASCAAELRLALLFETLPDQRGERALETVRLAAQARALRASDTPSGDARFSRRRANPGWLILAAATIVAVTLSVAVMMQSSAPPPTRPPGDGIVVRGQVIEIGAPVGSLEAAPEAFVWEMHHEVAQYRLTVEKVDGAVIWRTEAVEARVEVPAEVAARFAVAVTYRWSVEGLNARGLVIAASRVAEFRIVP